MAWLKNQVLFLIIFLKKEKDFNLYPLIYSLNIYCAAHRLDFVAHVFQTCTSQLQLE
jgi:hypothetical protein